MLLGQSIVHTVLRKYLRVSVLAAAATLMVGNAAWADKEKEKNSEPVKLLTTIPIPPTAANVGQNLYSYDISFVDQKTEMYYLADRSNNVVDVIDASSAAFVGQLSANPPFAGFVSAADCAAMGGNTCSGPTGVVAKIHWNGWGDAKTTGTGVGLWVGPHQIVADGIEQSVKIVAFHLGTCHGRRAYNAIEWFFPQHGQRFSKGSYINPCSGRYYRHGRPI